MDKHEPKHEPKHDKHESKPEKEHKPFDETQAVTKESLDARPEVEKQLHAAADQRSQTGGQSGVGSEVPAKLLAEELIDEDGNATPKAKREEAARKGGTDADDDDGDKDAKSKKKEK